MIRSKFLSLVLALALTPLVGAADVSLVMGPGNQSSDVTLRYLGGGGRSHLLSGYSNQIPDVLVTLVEGGGRAYLIDGYSTTNANVLYTVTINEREPFPLEP